MAQYSSKYTPLKILFFSFFLSILTHNNLKATPITVPNKQIATCFNGNVSIEAGNLLLINDIYPVDDYCDEDDYGTTTFGGNVIFTQHALQKLQERRKKRVELSFS